MVSTAHVKRSTIKDVARLAGVSPAAVTVALSRRQCTAAVSEKTRQRITEVAKQLDYKPNLLAKGLLARRSFLLAFLCREEYAPWIWNSMQGIQEVTLPRGYSLVCYSYPNSAKAELECLRLSMERQVEGVILLPMLEPNGENNGRTLMELHRKGVPIIQSGYSLWPDIPSVTLDMAQSAREAVRHFHGLGHRRIALYVSEGYLDTRLPSPYPADRQWYQGYQQAMRDAGLDPLVIIQPSQPFDAFFQDKSWFDALVRHPSRPTAVITTHINITVAIIRAAQERGLCIPRELSCSGHGIHQSIDPLPLIPTTFAQPDTGHRAAEMLFNWFDGREIATVALPSKLRVGQTSGPPRPD